MSFSLEVFATTLPEKLWAGWTNALAEQGIMVESRPGLALEKWRGGWASFKMRVRPGPTTDRYPDHAIVAGFELDVGPNEEAADLAGRVPEPVSSLVAGSATVFHFSTPAGRTVADLRLQCMAAATLAGLTGGAVYDPQQDAFFTGEAALANARREIEQHEEDPESSWQFERG